MPERVADYPRPPALVESTQHVRVEALGQELATSQRSLQVLETFHPPTVYLPPPGDAAGAAPAELRGELL